MAITGENAPKKRRPKTFSPSLAGHCLRYATMEMLGFGRAIDEETRDAMSQGSRRHKAFQAELGARFPMVKAEVALKDDGWGVSGRLDVLLETARGPEIIEYKTVGGDIFDVIQSTGPLVSHWAQLQLYLAVSAVEHGLLVVENRTQDGRVWYRGRRDPAWEAWLKERIQRVHQAVATRRLPSREISFRCLSCDRWQRCFPTAEARQHAVDEHPAWEPVPPVPPIRYDHVSYEDEPSAEFLA